MAKLSRPGNMAKKKTTTKNAIASKGKASKPGSIKKAIAGKPGKKTASKKASPKKVLSKKSAIKKSAPKKTAASKTITKKPVGKAALKKVVKVPEKKVSSGPASSIPSSKPKGTPVKDQTEISNNEQPLLEQPSSNEDPVTAVDMKVFNKATTKTDPRHNMKISSVSKGAIRPSAKKPLFRKG